MLMSRFRPKFIMWPTDQKDKMILWAQVNFDERAHVRRLGLLTGINLEVTISGRKLKSPELSIITKGIFVQKTHPQVIMFFEAAKNTSTRNLLNLIIEVSSSWIWSMIVSKASVEPASNCLITSCIEPPKRTTLSDGILSTSIWETFHVRSCFWNL